MKKKEFVTDFDVLVYNEILDTGLTTTTISKNLIKKPTAISRSIGKMKRLGLVKTMPDEGDKRKNFHIRIKKPDINEYR